MMMIPETKGAHNLLLFLEGCAEIHNSEDLVVVLGADGLKVEAPASGFRPAARLAAPVGEWPDGRRRCALSA